LPGPPVKKGWISGHHAEDRGKRERKKSKSLLSRFLLLTSSRWEKKRGCSVLSAEAATARETVQEADRVGRDLVKGEREKRRTSLPKEKRGKKKAPHGWRPFVDSRYDRLTKGLY